MGLVSVCSVPCAARLPGSLNEQLHMYACMHACLPVAHPPARPPCPHPLPARPRPRPLPLPLPAGGRTLNLSAISVPSLGMDTMPPLGPSPLADDEQVGFLDSTVLELLLNE